MEKRIGGPAERPKSLRVVAVRDGDPDPVAGPDEELLVIKIVDTTKDSKPDPTNGGAVSDDELTAEVERLERRRDMLKARKK